MKALFGKLVLILVVLVLTSSISAQWRLIESPSKADLNSAVQLTDTKAFVVGDYGTMLATNNRGSTWQNIDLGIKTNLNSIKFMDGDTYFNSYVIGDFGVILRTDSHWYNWEVISVASNYYNKDVSFANELNGIVVGYKYLGSSELPLSYTSILVTHNGGLTWVEKSINIIGKFNSVNFYDKDHAIAVGDAGLVAYSDDGGENWYMHRITARNLNAIRVCKSGVKFIVGNEGALYVAKDRHNRWENYSIGRFYDITSICQKSDNTFEITAVKKSSLGNNIIDRDISVILESREINGIWTEVFSTIVGPLNALNFCGSNSAIAVGDRGTIAVYHKDVIQDTVICVDTPAKIEMQNYPNPFNPSTLISFKLPEQTNVELKIYDVLGNEVATLVNENKPAGNYEVEWNASNLPSGVYIYQLAAGTNTQIKKMLLLK